MLDNEDKETTIELLIMKRELHIQDHIGLASLSIIFWPCVCLSLGLFEQAERNEDAKSKTRKELQISQLGNCIIRCVSTHGGGNCLSLFSNNSKTTRKLVSSRKPPNA